jgi:uncharacterized protein
MPRRSSATPHMVIGAGILIFRLYDCHSLKGKRSVIKAIIGQIRNHFNVSVAEVGANDVYQRAEIGFALAGSDHSLVNTKIDKILNFVDDLGLAEMVDSEMEIIHL